MLFLALAFFLFRLVFFKTIPAPRNAAGRVERYDASCPAVMADGRKKLFRSAVPPVNGDAAAVGKGHGFFSF